MYRIKYRLSRYRNRELAESPPVKNRLGEMQGYGNIMGIINDKLESQVWQTSWKLSVKFSLFRFATSAFQYETYTHVHTYISTW